MDTIKLKELTYNYKALCPLISDTTLEFHHDKHLASYVEKLNTAIQKEGIGDKTLVEVLASLDTLTPENATAIRNNGGGVFNHNFYFTGMTAATTTQPSKLVEDKITKDFGSIQAFKAAFKAAGMAQFGSGWAWLVQNGDKLEIITTANQDTPIELGLCPILTMDVWEHAYYLDYQNMRDNYIDAYLQLIDWNMVEKRMTVKPDCCSEGCCGK